MYHILNSRSAGSKNTPSLNTIAGGLGGVPSSPRTDRALPIALGARAPGWPGDRCARGNAVEDDSSIEEVVDEELPADVDVDDRRRGDQVRRRCGAVSQCGAAAATARAARCRCRASRASGCAPAARADREARGRAGLQERSPGDTVRAAGRVSSRAHGGVAARRARRHGRSPRRSPLLRSRPAATSTGSPGRTYCRDGRAVPQQRTSVPREGGRSRQRARDDSGRARADGQYAPVRLRRARPRAIASARRRPPARHNRLSARACDNAG